jgi:hypothetical protein
MDAQQKDNIMNLKKYYRIETNSCCGLITLENNKVSNNTTAPIFKKYIGNSLYLLKKKLLNKYGEVSIEELTCPNE